MKNLMVNYGTLIKITWSLTKSKDPEEIIAMTRLHKGQSEYIDTIAAMCESPEL